VDGELKLVLDASFVFGETTEKADDCAKVAIMMTLLREIFMVDVY